MEFISILWFATIILLIYQFDLNKDLRDENLRLTKMYKCLEFNYDVALDELENCKNIIEREEL